MSPSVPVDRASVSHPARAALLAALLAASLSVPGAARAQSTPFEPLASSDGPRLPMPRGARGQRYLGGPVPPGTHLERQHPTGVLLAGGALLLGAYAASVVLWNVNGDVRCSSDGSGLCSNSPWLAVPVVGPWLALGDAGNSGAMNVALIADGVAQAAGVAFGLVGVLRSYPVVVSDPEGSPPAGARAHARSRRGGASWSVVPGAAGAGLGLSLAGMF